MEGDIWKLVPADIDCLMRIDLTLVLPEYQRHGIARRMTAMRMDTAKQLGTPNLQILTHIIIIPALGRISTSDQIDL